MSQRKFSVIFPVPPRQHEYEAQMKVTMIYPWTLLYMLANFYMSGIFSSLNILIQTQLGHYLYHPTLDIIHRDIKRTNHLAIMSYSAQVF